MHNWAAGVVAPPMTTRPPGAAKVSAVLWCEGHVQECNAVYRNPVNL